MKNQTEEMLSWQKRRAAAQAVTCDLKEAVQKMGIDIAADRLFDDPREPWVELALKIPHQYSELTLRFYLWRIDGFHSVIYGEDFENEIQVRSPQMAARLIPVFSEQRKSTNKGDQK